MSMTRDMVQGFIDGYKQGGGDMTKLVSAVTVWATSHPNYPQDANFTTVIVKDLGSYRQ